ELVQQYDHMSDAGLVKPSDAGIATKRPEDAVEVSVGAKGLDHHGQGLLFIDDDAPCYVRIVGPDAGRRLELAKAIAKDLTSATAPVPRQPMIGVACPAVSASPEVRSSRDMIQAKRSGSDAMLWLAAPLVAQQAGHHLMGVVDTALLGRYSEAA